MPSDSRDASRFRDSGSAGEGRSASLALGLATNDLLERAGAGDGEALAELRRRYAGGLLRWASARVSVAARDSLETGELIDQCLSSGVTAHRASGRAGSFPFLWHLRRALSDGLARAATSAAPVDDGSPAQRGRSGETRLEATIGRPVLERYERALAELDAVDRELVLARVELGLGYDEVARTVGLSSPEAAGDAAARALARLARLMADARTAT
jgi:DNA-directed RNA polymerase specialized sigma24 family protein